LINVTDISNPDNEQQYEVVNDTLAEIGADNKEVINVFNKADEVQDLSIIDTVRRRYKDAVVISAKKGLNLDKLTEIILKKINKVGNGIQRS
jgi:GTP-binding protein HflX